jgi:nitrite reductase (NO-forming)
VAAILVVGYLAAAAGAVVGHADLRMPTWLALHLLALGAASNAVLVYSRHFAEALLHAGPGPEWPAHARIAGFNVGAVAVLGGVSAGARWLAVAGAAVVVLAVLAHTASLAAMVRHATLTGRLRVVTWYYVAAGLSLAVGATLGGAMAGGAVHTVPWQQSVRLAHAHLNLLGWLGLAVVGTQFMLWPAMLRTRMADSASRIARRVLWVSGTGLAVAVVGLLLTAEAPGAHWLAALGMAAYAAGTAYALVPAFAEMRVKAPWTASPTAFLAGNVWLLAALVLDVVALARGTSTADDLLGRLMVPMLGVGVVVQILTGALTFLLPVTVGGGPAGNRRMTEILTYAWVPRTLVGNLGALVLLIPDDGHLHALAWTLILAGFGSFPALVVAALAGRLTMRETASGPTRRRRPAGHELVAVVSVAAVLATLGLVATGTWPSGEDGRASSSSVTATSGVPVIVTLTEFAVTPGTITVAPGTDLLLSVRNGGTMTHDLKLGGETGTRMLSPGEQQTVDLGTITGDREAWCTVPGHRQAGMVLHIRTTTSSQSEAGSGHRGHDESQTMPGMDMETGVTDSPAPNWRPYDPKLRPALGGTEHHVTLRVEQTTLEVAPGVRQEVWTYNGTVPGPVLHGRVGDLFSVHLVNNGDMPHSIDFHAGQVDPGRAMRSIPPGGDMTVQFRAEHAGIWLYHCATMPMIQHLAMGMYGAVVIDPPHLGRVAAEDIFVQSEFYLASGGVPPMSDLLAADPDLVVFNGFADQYQHAPVPVPMGKRVRLWVLNAGPSAPSSFHVVGAQFDTVFKEGAYLVRRGNSAHGAAQALDLEPGQGGFVELKLIRPGSYPFLTHRLADAERGAMGALVARR